MIGLAPTLAAGILPLLLAGFSPYSTVELEQTVRGAGLHAPTGYVVLTLERTVASSRSCSYRMTDEGFPAGTDCTPGPAGGTDRLLVVIDLKEKTLVALDDEAGGQLLEPGGFRFPEYGASGPLSKLTSEEVAAWKLTPLAKRSPCPVQAAGSKLVYRRAASSEPLVASWSRGALAPDCIEGPEGLFLVTFDFPSSVINGDSDGGSTSVGGASVALVDGSSFDHAWQNTLGLRALLAKDRKTARAHFETALATKPDYAHANFNLACTLSLEKEPFEQGKRHLDAVLKDGSLRAKYLKKIETDTDLAAWRADPAFAQWFAGWRAAK
jgi:hypothetical protein